MSVRSFVSMSTMKCALKLKRELQKVPEQKLCLSQGGSEHFARLKEDPEKYFGKAHTEFRRLTKHINIKT